MLAIQPTTGEVAALSKCTRESSQEWHPKISSYSGFVDAFTLLGINCVMSSMDFDRSTQATSWIFDTSSLAACKEKAASTEDVQDAHRKGTRPKARKFASGFHQSFDGNSSTPTNTLPPNMISTEDQEALVQFHAHQIQTLIGPSAILVELRTNVTALATAVTFFRRFYLSNSVLSFNPRKVAAACAFFAAKVEDQKIEVSSNNSYIASHGVLVGGREGSEIFPPM